MVKFILKHPSAWLPLAMSVAAIGLMVGYLLMFGITRQTDEGVAAHLFQLLIGAQLPIMLFFGLVWVPKVPNTATKVLVAQVVGILLAFAPVYIFNF